jgi:hypothetical protein
MDRRSLTNLPLALRNAGYPPIRYRAVHEAARDAALPVQCTPRGRWSFDMNDLDAIAAALGLQRADRADIA